MHFLALAHFYRCAEGICAQLRTVLKKSDGLVIMEVTIDGKTTFEKHLSSVSRAASQRLGVSRKFWWVFHDRSLLGRCFRGFVLPVWSTVRKCCARLPIHTFNYWTVQSVVLVFQLRICSSVTLLIVDLWQCCVCSIRSGVTLCTLFMALYLGLVCQCGLYAVLLWSYIDLLINS